MLDNLPRHGMSEHYIRFIEETGAEHIGSFAWWVYFRKKTGGEPFALFSDINSRINHLNRIMLLIGPILVMLLIIGASSAYMGLCLENTFDLAIGIFDFALGLVMGNGFIYLFRKKRDLVREKVIRE
jgi:hypothetical protein